MNKLGLSQNDVINEKHMNGALLKFTYCKFCQWEFSRKLKEIKLFTEILLTRLEILHNKYDIHPFYS